MQQVIIFVEFLNWVDEQQPKPLLQLQGFDVATADVEADAEEKERFAPFWA
jgi:hypothetical protein